MTSKKQELGGNVALDGDIARSKPAGAEESSKQTRMFRERVEAARTALQGDDEDLILYLRGKTTPSPNVLQDVRDAIAVLEGMTVGPCDGKHDPVTLSDAAQRRITALGYLYRAGETLILGAEAVQPEPTPTDHA